MGDKKVNIRIEIDDDDAHQAYKELEEEHKQGVDRLNAEAARRKQTLDRKLAEARRLQKVELVNKIEMLQKQCDEVESRFNDEKHKRQLENGTLAPRIKKAYDMLQEQIDSDKGEYKAELAALQDEIDQKYAELSKVSVQIAEAEARMEALETDLKDAIHRKEVGKEMHTISLTDLKKKVEETRRHNEKESEKLQTDLEAKDHSLELALKKLDGAYQENELKRKDYLAKSEKNLKYLKAEILRLQDFKTLVDNKTTEKANELETDIKKIKENLGQAKKAEEAAAVELKDACALKAAESQEYLTKQKADLLRVGRDLSAKLSEAAAVLKSMSDKGEDLDKEFDAKMNELRQEYGDAISDKQQVYQEIQEHHEEALNQGNKLFQNQQGEIKGQLQRIEELENKIRKQHETNGQQMKKAIAEKYQALQKLVKQSKVEEDKHFQEIGKLQIIIEDQKLRSNILRPLIQRLDNNANDELNLLDNLYKSSETGFAHKIYEKDQELRQLMDGLRDVENAIMAQEFQLDSTFHLALEGDREKIKILGKEIEKLKCSNKLLKSELELQNSKNCQASMTLDNQLRQEREDHLQEKRRLYKELQRQKQGYNKNVDSLHAKIKEAQDAQAALEKARDRQEKELTKQFAMRTDRQHANFAALHKKVDDLKVNVQDVEGKIAALKLNPPSQSRSGENKKDNKITSKKNQLLNLQNKLYTIETCAAARKQQNDTEALNSNLSQLKQDNQELENQLKEICESYDKEKEKFTVKTNSMIKKLKIVAERLAAENLKLRQRRDLLQDKSKLQTE